MPPLFHVHRAPPLGAFTYLDTEVKIVSLKPYVRHISAGFYAAVSMADTQPDSPTIQMAQKIHIEIISPDTVW